MDMSVEKYNYYKRRNNTMIDLNSIIKDFEKTVKMIELELVDDTILIIVGFFSVIWFFTYGYKLVIIGGFKQFIN